MKKEKRWSNMQLCVQLFEQKLVYYFTTNRPAFRIRGQLHKLSRRVIMT